MEDILGLELQAVAAVDENWGLGREGRLLARVAPDMKRFRQLTTGQRVIYGRKTLATFPEEKPLPARENILLTHDPHFQAEGIVPVHSLAELERLLRQRQAAEPKINFVIGGAEVYRQLLPWCSQAHITLLHRTFPADRFLPPLSGRSDWCLDRCDGPYEWQGLSYSFCTYKRA